VPNRTKALSLLESVGYYRLSAYAYPFRTPLPRDAMPETSVQFRQSSFEPGASFEWVQQLWEFDRSLRLLLLDAIEMVEIALRAKVGYHLGYRNTFGYLSPDGLDAAKCDRRHTEDSGLSMFDLWLEHYREHQTKAASEDFIQHYVEKYDAVLPVWVATEIMEFGQLVRLYGFMLDVDQSAVSREIAGVSGAVFVRWMKVANYARNLSAHHARLWNRTLTYKLGRGPENAPELTHLNDALHSRQRIYAVAAILSYLTDRIRPEAGWRARLNELLDRFPTGLPVSPEVHMGFPTGWRSLELWSPQA
jgi:abortive infection bacteriophage resistance protein